MVAALHEGTRAVWHLTWLALGSLGGPLLIDLVVFDTQGPLRGLSPQPWGRRERLMYVWSSVETKGAAQMLSMCSGGRIGVQENVAIVVDELARVPAPQVAVRRRRHVRLRRLAHRGRQPIIHREVLVGHCELFVEVRLLRHAKPVELLEGLLLLVHPRFDVLPRLLQPLVPPLLHGLGSILLGVGA